MNFVSQWFSSPLRKIGFEDVKYIIGNSKSSKYLLINTLPNTEQDCLIHSTISSIHEETRINELIENYESKSICIIIYGKHSADNSVEMKYRQLTNLGFSEVYVYGGGVFEWILLQDIYGASEFPTTSVVRDILKYRPEPTFRS